MNAPQSRRFAPIEDSRQSRQRLDCGDFSTAFAHQTKTADLKFDSQLTNHATSDLLQLPALLPLVAKWRQVQSANASRLNPDVIEKLFTRELNSSVSRLEDFAACPFKFFAASGLRLRERKEFQFDDRDKGTFHHNVLDEFHRRVIASGRRWRDLAPTEAANLAESIARELLPAYENGKFLRDGAARFTGEQLIERIKQLIATLIAWMPQYDFDPTASEIAFNDAGDGLPSWRFELPDGHALKLVGRIDRVDLLKRDDQTALAVVMDYKSRVKKLDETKFHHGLELQLLSYLGVLNQLRDAEKIFGVKSLMPAGVFYVPLNGGATKASFNRADVLASDDESRRDAYQHSGRFLGDELAHFDNRGVPKGDQFKFAKVKSGEFGKRGNEALPAVDFTALREKVESHLRDYGQQIFTGDAKVSINIPRVLFFLLGIVIVGAAVWQQGWVDFLQKDKTHGDNLTKPENIEPDESTYRNALNLVIALNALLLINNVIDIRYVWFADLSGKTALQLKEYVHEGTYLLIFQPLRESRCASS